MISDDTALLVFGALLGGAVVGAIATIRLWLISVKLHNAQAEAIAAGNWLHHNLRLIRAHTGYAFPESESVCNSLETAFPTRSPVDIEGLEIHLCALRRQHNARILAEAQSKIAELKGAIALGQENCDAEYERLRAERDEARAVLAMSGGAS